MGLRVGNLLTGFELVILMVKVTDHIIDLLLAPTQAHVRGPVPYPGLQFRQRLGFLSGANVNDAFVADHAVIFVQQLPA